jgi:uracil-DNA glycosylase
MAVDNEPVPFWNGRDEDDHVARWKAAVGFRDGEWGEVAGVGALNGSSGDWVDVNVLQPLGAGREEACITDCVDLYFSSNDGATRVRDTYLPFAERVGLPRAQLSAHPSENDIVKQGVEHHRERLLRELATAAPDIVVTLGNAALRVLRTVAGASDGASKLQANSNYGTELALSVGGRRMTWLPLAHPAAPRVYQDAHSTWCRTRTSARPEGLA